MKYWALLLCGLLASFRISGIEASAQEYAGPLLPHVGAQITAAFANRYGPDAGEYSRPCRKNRVFFVSLLSSCSRGRKTGVASAG